jgi:regulatory protein
MQPGCLICIFAHSHIPTFSHLHMTKEQVLQKVRHYCGYQERSHREVKEKLYSFKLRKQVVEECIAQLIEEDYLNEERFAIQFAGGKFRMLNWGRNKIAHELNQRGVSQYCINKGLKEIDDDAYCQSVQKLAERKWALLEKEGTNAMRQQKTRLYLMQKGYEASYIEPALKSLLQPASAGR